MARTQITNLKSMLFNPLHLQWKLSLWLTLVTHSIVKLPLAHNNHWYHWIGDALCSIVSMVFPTPASEQHKSSSLRFVQPGINTDVHHWARSCIQCQRAKIQRHSHTPLSSFPVPDASFNVIHIDLVGPLPTARGFTYLLTCVDHFTRWPETFPLSHITAEVVAQAFLSG